MLRRIWHRTAALAIPIALAICLPPLAVIAFNLHAQSAGPEQEIASLPSVPTRQKHSARTERRTAQPMDSAPQRNQLASNGK
jgi:hypothetical protein